MEVFVYFFSAFIFVAVVLAFLTKKTFIYCLGNMFMVAAIAIILWSIIIDDGSRRGMEALVLAIMWGMAAGSFLVGFILRRIGVSQNRKKVATGVNAVEKENPDASNPQKAD